jgi:predicted nucleotidyltransferase
MRQLLDQLREVAAIAFGGTPVVFAYLFGSQATGRMHRRSDVDVAVYLEEDAAGDFWLVIGELTRRLEDASGVRGIEMLDLSKSPLRLRGAGTPGGGSFSFPGTSL